MKKTIVLALCCLVFITSYAQKNMKEGFVVLNSGDTLKGFIDYREWYKNPGSILFGVANAGDMRRYKLKDITCFAVDGSEMYQRYYVKMSMDRILMGNIGEKDTSSRMDTVFLKVLQTGNKVTLFSYSDDVKKRLYILPANETIPVELQNSEYIVNGQVINEKEYRSVLLSIARNYMPDAADLQTFIYNQDYSQNNIMNICYKINGISPQAVVKQKEKNIPSRFRFFAGVGVNSGEISIGGNNHYAGKTAGATYGTIVDAGADILVNPSIGRLFLRSQLTASAYKTNAYTSVKYYEAKENYYLTFNQRNIALHEQLNYNLYNGHNLKWFVGAGVGVNFSSYPENEEKFIREGLGDTTSSINDKYVVTIKNFWLNTALRSGFTIKNLDVALAYYPKTSLSQNSVIGVYNSSLQLQVNYVFFK
ncbi:hypothetical protein FC093_07865 [Ilyomonas limi]|uniref:Outer membrane protein beta-barrel domain-containing protein n=1 Tax=Ilyomonas limi TaxID=2575867 RepID=A0A4U3L4H2_9BACT|nr:hypothetical protein [Ilyomonas limi]TKK69224.1 hypothetical protein FC093_07865 [Ilyomonas limi]